MLTVHSSYGNYKLRNKIFLFISFIFFSAIVHVSESARDSFPGFFRRISRKKTYIVKNGIDTDRIDNAVRSRRAKSLHYDKDFKVIAVSQHKRAKNLDTLLRAFAAFAGERDKLCIIGDGPLYDHFLRRSECLNIKANLTFLRCMSRDDVYKHIAESDIFVSTSIVEGLPVAPLEAMACGCPVILSDISPHREIALNNKEISFTKCRDVRGLVDILRFFRESTRQDLEKKGRVCRQYAIEHFSLKVTHEKYDDIYREMAGLDKISEREVLSA